MTIGLIFGTRPEAIKIFSIYNELKKNNINIRVISTGQHKEMLYQVLNLFKIKVDYEMEIMKEGQELAELTSRLIKQLDEIIKKENLDLIFVQGDTTSALTGALTGFYNKIPIAHLEAGLRTDNIYSPFPEEINRKLISSLSTYHFTPTYLSTKNLESENIIKNVYEVGNTVIDSLLWIKNKKENELIKIRNKYGLKDKKYILITMHRRENLEKNMQEILQGIKKYLNENNDLWLVFPMHKNPIIRKIVKENLEELNNKILLEPLEYLEFIAIMDGAYYIMTDSGGIQEEAPTLGKPTLILRDTTERPEGIIAGTAKMAGTTKEDVYMSMKNLTIEEYLKMSKVKNPYGVGDTSKKIVTILKEIGLI